MEKGKILNSPISSGAEDGIYGGSYGFKIDKTHEGI